jgi:hypothetical protein
MENIGLFLTPLIFFWADHLLTSNNKYTILMGKTTTGE